MATSQPDFGLTDGDIEQLQEIKDDFARRDSSGLSQVEHGRRNGNHRRGRLPSDLACYDCGGAIAHGDRVACPDHGDGVNEYGEFSRCGCRVLRCQECADG